MIIGIGNDLVDIRRIEKIWEIYGEKFIRRFFTDDEQETAARSRNRRNQAAIYAKRFAAKEACAKAIGTGFRYGMRWKDLSVGNNILGRPQITLSGEARKILDNILPDGMVASINLTLTDEYPYAQAIVLISAEPQDETG